jgi:hypothetical protein
VHGLFRKSSTTYGTLCGPGCGGPSSRSDEPGFDAVETYSLLVSFFSSSFFAGALILIV